MGKLIMEERIVYQLSRFGYGIRKAKVICETNKQFMVHVWNTGFNIYGGEWSERKSVWMKRETYIDIESVITALIGRVEMQLGDARLALQRYEGLLENIKKKAQNGINEFIE